MPKLPEHIANALQADMEKGMKNLLAHDLWPETMTFMLAKTALIKETHKKYGINIQFRFGRKLLKKGYIKLGICFLLSKLPPFQNFAFILFLDRLTKLHFKFRPKWYYVMDGHQLFMNEGDASMRAILQDYIAVGNKSFIDARPTEAWERVWEPETTKVVKEKVKTGDICVDIGASVGYYTLLFSRQAGPTGKVFAFEPTTNQIPYIRKNIEKNGYENIAKVFHMGAWDKTETVDMPVHAPIKYRVPCTPVDDILEQEGITKVDFIKIDVDGVEPKVLRGLIRTFERSPNLKMVIEYYPKYLLQAGCSPEEFMEIINKYFSYTVIPGDYEDGCWNYYCERKVAVPLV